MTGSRYWLLAPYYLFGGLMSVIFGVLMLLGGWSAHASRGMAVGWPIGFCCVGVLAFSAAAWILGRGATSLDVTDDRIELRSLTRLARLELSASALPTSVHFTRLNEDAVDGPVVVEDTAAKRALGSVLTAVEFDAFGVIALMPGFQDFIAVSVTRANGAVERYIAPDLSRINAKGYGSLRAWLTTHAVPLTLENFPAKGP